MMDKIKENHISAMENLQREFSDRLQISMNIKILLCTIFILFTEHSEHYTNLSTLNHNVQFLPCQHRGVGIMQNHALISRIILIIPDTPPEKFPVRAVDIVNPGIQ